MTGTVLVIGYGNALRTDDGLGWHAADRLVSDRRLDGVTVVQLHQLAPELALDVSRAALVVLVDASSGLPPGVLAIGEVARAEAGSGSTWSHHLDPSTLLALADELYGHSTRVFTVSIGVVSTEAGDRLSPVVEAAMPRVIDAVADLIATHAPTLTGVAAGAAGADTGDA